METPLLAKPWECLREPLAVERLGRFAAPGSRDGSVHSDTVGARASSVRLRAEGEQGLCESK